MAASLQELRTEAAGLVAALDPDCMPGSEARAALDAVLATAKLLDGARLLLAGRVAETRSWGGDGARSLEDWLCTRSGGSFGAARRDAETADALAAQPMLRKALRRGEVSAEQAGAVSGASKADPTAEHDLVERARTETLRQTRRRADDVVAAARSADAEAERSRRQHETRRVRFGADPDGSWTMDAKLTPQAGAEVQAELERLSRGAFKAARDAGRREGHGAYLADALVELGRRSTTGQASADCPAPKPKVAVSVIVDLPALQRGTTASGERCEIPGIGPVPVAWAADQLGDAILRLFLRHGRELRTLATTARSPSEHMKVALSVLHRGCVVCGSRHATEIHHTTSATGWADTHRTRLTELAPLCSHDHDLVTTQGYRLEAGPRPFTWALHPPDRPPP